MRTRSPSRRKTRSSASTRKSGLTSQSEPSSFFIGGPPVPASSCGLIFEQIEDLPLILRDPYQLIAASHHLATFTLKVTLLAPPAFLMTNLYCPSLFGVTLTEHFGPGESSLATSAPEES